MPAPLGLNSAKGPQIPSQGGFLILTGFVTTSNRSLLCSLVGMAGVGGQSTVWFLYLTHLDGARAHLLTGPAVPPLVVLPEASRAHGSPMLCPGGKGPLDTQAVPSGHGDPR